MRPPRKINVGFTKIRLSKFVIHEEWPFADKRNLDQRPYNTYIYVCCNLYYIMYNIHIIWAGVSLAVSFPLLEFFLAVHWGRRDFLMKWANSSRTGSVDNLGARLLSNPWNVTSLSNKLIYVPIKMITFHSYQKVNSRYFIRLFPWH